MGHLPKKKRIMLVLLLVSMSPAWSLSLVDVMVESPYNIVDDPLHSRHI
jgi:hypothetical protein